MKEPTLDQGPNHSQNVHSIGPEASHLEKNKMKLAFAGWIYVLCLAWLFDSIVLFACLLACLLSCVLACLLACLLLVCLFVCFLTSFLLPCCFLAFFVVLFQWFISTCFVVFSLGHGNAELAAGMTLLLCRFTQKAREDIYIYMICDKVLVYILGPGAGTALLVII